MATPPRTVAQVIADLAARSALVGSGCVEWTAGLNGAGYGQFAWTPEPGRKIQGAHRVAYHALVAPLSAGMVIDHLCRNRKCIRLDHLEAVRQRENVMRSTVAIATINAAKTHCPQGHEYTPENTYVYRCKTRSTTVRICRACRAEYRRRVSQQGRAA